MKKDGFPFYSTPQLKPRVRPIFFFVLHRELLAPFRLILILKTTAVMIKVRLWINGLRIPQKKIVCQEEKQKKPQDMGFFLKPFGRKLDRKLLQWESPTLSNALSVSPFNSRTGRPE